MLSILIITVISVVALPQLRITTLSIVRTISMAYALTVFVLMQSSSNYVLSLFNDSLSVDTMSTHLAALFLIIQISILAHYSNDKFSGIIPYSLVILLLIITIGGYYIILSSDIITLAISLELQSFSLYALTTIYRWREGATSSGLIYFMLGAFSSGLFLLGISMLYAFTGETSLNVLSAYFELSFNSAYIKTGLLVIMSGLFFKITAAPFHYWGPEVYDRVPTVITVLINVLPKFALIGVIIRIIPLIITMHLSSYLKIVCVMSWGFGSVIALAQTRIKRLLAYSTVNHVGWIIAAIMTGYSIGFGSFFFYIFQYSFTSVLIFIALIAISFSKVIISTSNPSQNNNNKNNNSREISSVFDIEIINDLNGLYFRSVIFTVILSAAFFSAAGIPPIIGFFAKLSVIQAIMYTSNYILVILGIIFSIISAGFYLSVISAIVFKTSSVKAASNENK